MAPVHRKLDPPGGRFIILREQQNAPVVDAFSTPTDVLIYALTDGDGNIPDGVQAPTQTVQIFDASGNEKVKVYWTTDTPGGLADLSLWIRNRTGTWIQQGAKVSALAPDTFVTFNIHGASQAFILIGGTPTGNNIRVLGQGIVD